MIHLSKLHIDTDLQIRPCASCYNNAPEKALQLRSAATKTHQIVVLYTWQILTVLRFISVSQLLSPSHPISISLTYVHTILKSAFAEHNDVQHHLHVLVLLGCYMKTRHAVRLPFWLIWRLFTEAAALESHWDVYGPTCLSGPACDVQW